MLRLGSTAVAQMPDGGEFLAVRIVSSGERPNPWGRVEFAILPIVSKFDGSSTQDELYLIDNILADEHPRGSEITGLAF